MIRKERVDEAPGLHFQVLSSTETYRQVVQRALTFEIQGLEF